MTKPFRWNIGKREQLGSLAGTLAYPPARPFIAELRSTAARMLTFAEDADLAFIGRTPESFYDYLSGIFLDIPQSPRLHLIQLSVRYQFVGGQTLGTDKLKSLLAYFAEEGFDPLSISRRQRPLAIVDMIQHGGTMERLVLILNQMAHHQNVDWRAVQRRLRIIGIRVRTKNSPNTWRWQQHQDWLHLIPDTVIKNISASHQFVSYITGLQLKVTDAFTPSEWRTPRTVAPATTPEVREAIAFAAHLFDLGNTQAERRALAARIAASKDLRHPATRALVLALKN